MGRLWQRHPKELPHHGHKGLALEVGLAVAPGHEHDLAYEQVNSEEDRLWADAQFLRCMNANAYPNTGHICFSIIRLFGWSALLPKRIAKLFQTT